MLPHDLGFCAKSPLHNRTLSALLKPNQIHALPMHNTTAALHTEAQTTRALSSPFLSSIYPEYARQIVRLCALLPSLPLRWQQTASGHRSSVSNSPTIRFPLGNSPAHTLPRLQFLHVKRYTFIQALHASCIAYAISLASLLTSPYLIPSVLS